MNFNEMFYIDVNKKVTEKLSALNSAPAVKSPNLKSPTGKAPAQNAGKPASPPQNNVVSAGNAKALAATPTPVQQSAQLPVPNASGAPTPPIPSVGAAAPMNLNSFAPVVGPIS